MNKALTKVTDALGSVRNFSYDGLGQRLTAQDLHASADSSFGSWSYTFDPAGNLTQVVDPKSQTINYGYDALNRKTTEDYTGQAGVGITNTYDVCNDGKGRLCIASATASHATYNYNPLGLQSSASSTMNGTSTSFVTQYSYDRQGNKTPSHTRFGYRGEQIGHQRNQSGQCPDMDICRKTPTFRLMRNFLNKLMPESLNS